MKTTKPKTFRSDVFTDILLETLCQQLDQSQTDVIKSAVMRMAMDVLPQDEYRSLLELATLR